MTLPPGIRMFSGEELNVLHNTSIIPPPVTSGTSSELRVRTGAASKGGSSGLLYFASGAVTGSGRSGAVGIESGEAESDTGDMFIGTSTPTVGGKSGSLFLYSGNATGAGEKAGDVEIDIGQNASGTAGNMLIGGLPTTDPLVAGALWIDTAANRVVKSSNG